MSSLQPVTVLSQGKENTIVLTMGALFFAVQQDQFSGNSSLEKLSESDYLTFRKIFQFNVYSYQINK